MSSGRRKAIHPCFFVIVIQIICFIDGRRRHLIAPRGPCEDRDSLYPGGTQVSPRRSQMTSTKNGAPRLIGVVLAASPRRSRAPAMPTRGSRSSPSRTRCRRPTTGKSFGAAGQYETLRRHAHRRGRSRTIGATRSSRTWHSPRATRAAWSNTRRRSSSPSRSTWRSRAGSSCTRCRTAAGASISAGARPVTWGCPAAGRATSPERRSSASPCRSRGTPTARRSPVPTRSPSPTSAQGVRSAPTAARRRSTRVSTTRRFPIRRRRPTPRRRCLRATLRTR